MVAAGYTMYVVCTPGNAPLIPFPRYGSSANLVLSTGQGVNGYTLDASLGEFILTHPDVRLPQLNFILVLTHEITDPDSPSREDLLLQRRERHVFPSSCQCLPEIDQIPRTP